jgi:hypothetical protein
LEGQIAVNGDEDFKLSRGEREEFAVLFRRPPHLRDGLDLVPAQLSGEAAVNTLV